MAAKSASRSRTVWRALFARDLGPLAVASSFSSCTSSMLNQNLFGVRALVARRPFTKSCSKYHFPAATSATRVFQMPFSPRSNPPMTRPPLNTGRAPLAASKLTGACAVPLSSCASTSGSANV